MKGGTEMAALGARSGVWSEVTSRLRIMLSFLAASNIPSLDKERRHGPSKADRQLCVSG
jgi:hypothetical protein